MASSRWSVKAITATYSDMDGPDTGYGHVFDVKFEMIYKKSPNAGFEEMPLLDWQEKITFVDHANQTWWTFGANMYHHKRASKTLEVWTRRYVTAYDTAMGLGSDLLGSCTLYTTRSLLGRKKVKKLPKVEGNIAKADAVREYLRKEGGELEIVVSDRPALKKQNVERLLLFIDVRVMIPGSTKWNGYQHLVVSDTPQRTASVEHGRNDLVPPNGYNQVDPPADVATRKDDPMFGGEYW